MHLTTVFPDVRLKRFIEMRGADAGDWRCILALPALWVGLLYDEQALQEALQLTSDWTQIELDHLQNEVPRLALQTPFRDGSVQDVALEVLAIARGGLKRRGLGEERYLDVLDGIAGNGGLTGVFLWCSLRNLFWFSWPVMLSSFLQRVARRKRTCCSDCMKLSGTGASNHCTRKSMLWTVASGSDMGVLPLWASA